LEPAWAILTKDDRLAELSGASSSDALSPTIRSSGRKEEVDSERLKRKSVYGLTMLVVVLFVFLAPVVPTTVTRFWLLPWRNQCIGGIQSPSNPQFRPVPVYASISYVIVQLLIDATAGTYHGLFGLIIVPNDIGYTVQFPPLGWENVICH
jgi:hypothetical protein